MEGRSTWFPARIHSLHPQRWQSTSLRSNGRQKIKLFYGPDSRSFRSTQQPRLVQGIQSKEIAGSRWSIRGSRFQERHEIGSVWRKIARRCRRAQRRSIIGAFSTNRIGWCIFTVIIRYYYRYLEIWCWNPVVFTLYWGFRRCWKQHVAVYRRGTRQRW